MSHHAHSARQYSNSPSAVPTESMSVAGFEASPVSPSRRLGSYLVEAGLITDAQIEVVLNDQTLMDGMRFGEVLAVRGWVKSETIDFIMRRVVEPERARLNTPSTPSSPIHPPVAPPMSAPPPMPAAPPSPVASPPVLARARSLDGSFEFNIVQHFNHDDLWTDSDDSDIGPTIPLTQQEMQNLRWNDRKSLPSVPNEDDVNWAG